MKNSKFIILGILTPIMMIGGGIGTFYILGYINYGIIQESYTYYHIPAISAEPEKIRIHTNGRSLNIKHNSSSIPYYIKADVNLKAEGMYLKNSDYNYFSTWWDNYTSEEITQLIAHSIGRTLGGFYHPSWSAKYDININMTLRTDILYELFLNTYNTEIFISENLTLILHQ